MRKLGPASESAKHAARAFSAAARQDFASAGHVMAGWSDGVLVVAVSGPDSLRLASWLRTEGIAEPDGKP